MNLSNSELDQLFKDFREEKPQVSFDETQKDFLKATVLAAGGVLATKGILKLFTFKQWIIMISVLSTATVGTLMVTMSSGPAVAENKAEHLEMDAKKITVDAKKEIESPKEELETFVATLEALAPEVKTEIKSEGRPAIQVVAYSNGDGTYSFNYIITAETSKEDLEELEKKAKEAGFDLVCTPKFDGDKLQHLSLHIIQKEKSGQETNIVISDIDLKEKSEYRVAWNVDEEGAATTIACGQDFTSAEVSELLAKTDIEALTDDILHQYDLVDKELKELEAHDLLDVEKYLEQFERASDILDDEKIQASLLALEAVDLKDLEKVTQDLFDAQKEVSALEKELKIASKNYGKASKIMIEALLSDGLIKDSKKRLKVHASKGEISVNGKKIPDNLQSKYEKLILENFRVDVTNKENNWTWSHYDN